MKKSNSFFIALYILAAAAVAYFAFVVVRERYFSPKDSNVNIQKSEKQSVSNQQGQDQSSTTPEDVPGVENQSSEGTHSYVTSGDCDNDCQKFKDNTDGLKYCQQVCGISPTQKKNSEDECLSLAGLEKDYCWRDLAVSKKDFEICNKISDQKLKTVCRNRVTEEVLN